MKSSLILKFMFNQNFCHNLEITEFDSLEFELKESSMSMGETERPRS